nr:NS3 protein [Hipposideros bat coronavirus]
MDTGLFTLQFSSISKSIASAVKHVPELKMEHALPVTSFLFTSIFIVYFAIYKASSVRNNCVLFCIRLFAMFVYAPLLCYFESYVDASIIFIVLLLRLIYISYWSFRYRTPAFLVLNTDKLAFVQGYYWYYTDDSYITLIGGENFLTFGPNFVPFALSTDIYIALRGRKDDDVPLVRRVELINGQFFYIFSQENVVGVVNMRFNEIKLCDDVEITPE